MEVDLPSPAPHDCFIYLFRHGATANNVANPPLLQGCSSNPELSVEGLRQADQASRFFAEVHVDAFYASPLIRARQTAERIAAPHSRPVAEIEELTECDVGQWEGRCWEEIERSEPEAYQRFMSDPAKHAYQGGENQQQVLDRTLPALETLGEAHLGQVIVVVAHNVVNRGLLTHFMGLPLSTARGVIQNNCGVNVLRYRRGKFKPLTINAVFHLNSW